MSKFEVDRDGFQIVKTKRFSKNKHTSITRNQIQLETQYVEIDIDKAISRIKDALEDFRGSTYLADVLKSVSNVLHSRNIVEIVCLGLGHVSECNIAKFQLALLLCLKEQYNPQKVLVHDPIFYNSECEILSKLNLDIILENNEGNYVIKPTGVSLVYLPHCPKQLTNNFLWANWGQNLQNCILICNSFRSLIDNQPSRILEETVPYIFKISPHLHETLLENSFKYTDIFNDTSIHEFQIETLSKLPPEFWTKGTKPSYNNTEEFITKQMIEKLNI